MTAGRLVVMIAAAVCWQRSSGLLTMASAEAEQGRLGPAAIVDGMPGVHPVST
jgi:hypothetical protein